MSTPRTAASPPDQGSIVMLADGTEATVRRLRPGDRHLVEELFQEARDEDLYTRFFTVGRVIVDRHIDHLFAPDSLAVTYVAERGDHLLGIAEVEPEGDGVAEVAFMVADGAHGLGIGTLLLERAAEEAWDRGITTFVADVLPVNHLMLEVFRDAGFEVEMASMQGDVSVRISTCRRPESVAAAAARHAAALAHHKKLEESV